jgi:hypothetical protein
LSRSFVGLKRRRRRKMRSSDLVTHPHPPTHTQGSNGDSCEALIMVVIVFMA